MAQVDKERWDIKHSKNMMPQEPIKLVKDYVHLATKKQALDVACGNGRHSRYLASIGFEVDALDISSIAIEQLQGVSHIHTTEVDFDTYTLEKNKYDLIVCTYYLERKLFPQFEGALKKNGILIFETFLHNTLNERAPSNLAFILEEEELETYFDHRFELLHISKWWDKDYQGYKVMKSSMVARKKSREME